MKKLFKAALVAVCILSVSSFAKAQVKIGYINQSEVIQLMPELKTVNTQMDAYKKTFIDEMTRQQTELQRASGDYQTKRATMSDATRTAKEAELTDMQKRFQDYQNTANQSVEAKGAEYMKPVLERLHVAIDAVAKEKGFTYVFDTAQTALLVSPPADDMAAAVKLKLGLK